MMRQLDLAETDLIDALGDQIYLDPAGDVWRTQEDYLSGDVVGRLEDARAAAERDERYRRNVEALEAVQPAPLTRIDIRVLCGAPWVPADIYRSFLKEHLGIERRG
jgi:N12 class adenine-specific DNA methylase